MIRRLVLWLAAFVVAFAVAGGARAEGDEAVGNAPRDVPMAIVGLEAPPLPSGFESEAIGEWLTVEYPKGMRDRIAPAMDEASAFRDDLVERFGQPILKHVEVRLARTPEEMTDLAPHKAPPPAYAVGVAYPSLDLVLISNVEPRTSEGANVPEVLRHELVHLALKDAVDGRHVPLWFNEGLAIFLSGEHAFDRWQTLENAELSGTLLPLADLDRNFPPEGVNVAYAESADFVRFLMRDQDRSRFTALVSRTRGGQAFDRALGDAYGSDMRKLEYQWKDDLSSRVSVWPAILGGSALWVAAIAVLVWAYVKRRKRAKATLAKWAEEEAAQDRARAALARIAEDEPDGVVVARVSGLPRVEHDGRWYTLH